MGNTGSSKSPFEKQVLKGHSWPVRGCAFSPTEPLIASASTDDTVRLWRKDDTTGQWEPGQVLKGHSNSVLACAFSPTEPLFTSASTDRTVRLWRKDDTTGQWEPGQVLKGHSDSVFGCAFSPTEPLLASASADRTVRLWRKERTTGQWEPGQVLEGHSSWVYGCAFSPTEPLLASVSWDMTVRLWRKERTTGQWEPGQVLEGHSSWVYGCAFSPTEPLLASASDDRTVRLWRKDNTTDQWEPGQVLEGHSSEVYSCAFSPTEPLLASASEDKTVRLWCKDDTAGQWEPGQVLEGHSNPVFGCTFSPTEPTLASASEDSTVRLWTVPQGPTSPSFTLDTLLQSPCISSDPEDPQRQSLVKLNSLIGLVGIKKAVALYAAFMNQRGVQARLEWNNIALAGPPGTGKTTVARVLAQIMITTGLVETFLEMSVSDLKGEYVGHTFIKAMKFLRQHRGKVLFFDEANTLYTGGNDYGREAASAIIKFFEEDLQRVKDGTQRHPTVLIVAGYKDALERGFFGADEGMKRRVPNFFTFSDYNAQELAAILVLRARHTEDLELAPEVEGSPAHAREGGGAADAEASIGEAQKKVPTGSAALVELIRPHTQEGQGSAKQPPPLFSSGNGRFCNGGGMETLLQRAQHCCAAASVGSAGGAGRVMTVTMADIRQGLKLMLDEPVEIVPRRVADGGGGGGGVSAPPRTLSAAPGEGGQETKASHPDPEARAQQGQAQTVEEGEAVDRAVADAESCVREEIQRQHEQQQAEFDRQLGEVQARTQATAVEVARAAAAEQAELARAAAAEQAELARQLGQAQGRAEAAAVVLAAEQAQAACQLSEVQARMQAESELQLAQMQARMDTAAQAAAVEAEWAAREAAAQQLEAEARLQDAEAVAAEAAANQQAEYERQLAEAVAAQQAEHERQLAEAVAAQRAEHERKLAGALAVQQAESEARLQAAAQAAAAQQAALQRRFAATQRQAERHGAVASAFRRRLAIVKRAAKGTAIALGLFVLASTILAVLGFLKMLGASLLALVAAAGVMVALVVLVWFCLARLWRKALAWLWRKALALLWWLVKLVMRWLGPWGWALLVLLLALLVYVVLRFVNSTTGRLVVLGLAFSLLQLSVCEWLEGAKQEGAKAALEFLARGLRSVLWRRWRSRLLDDDPAQPHPQG